MRVLWQKLPDGTFARVSSGITWVESYDGTASDAGITAAMSGLPTNGLIATDPEYEVEEWPEGYMPVMTKGSHVDIYMAVDGDDSNDGRTEETAIASLERAAEIITRTRGPVALFLGEGEFDWSSEYYWNRVKENSPYLFIIGKSLSETFLNGSLSFNNTYIEMSGVTSHGFVWLEHTKAILNNVHIIGSYKPGFIPLDVVNCSTCSLRGDILIDGASITVYTAVRVGVLSHLTTTSGNSFKINAPTGIDALTITGNSECDLRNSFPTFLGTPRYKYSVTGNSLMRIGSGAATPNLVDSSSTVI